MSASSETNRRYGAAQRTPGSREAGDETSDRGRIGAPTGARRRLVIQIPCFNEEATIGTTLAALPRHVAGFESVEWLIVDDGSTDGTVAAAIAAGVDHVVSLPHNQGLARAFMAGIEASLKQVETAQ